MTPTRSEVLDWLETRLNRRLSVVAQADLLAATGLDRSAARGLMAEYAARFAVDLADYRDEMHAGFESLQLTPGWPVPVRGVRVPLSVTLLHDAAVNRRWRVVYPAVLPVVRDMSWINVPLLAAGLILATLTVMWAVPRLF